MNQELFEKYFNNIINSIDSLPLPMALVDESLRLIWANPYLRSNFPYLSASDSILTLLKGHNKINLIENLRASSSSHSYFCKMPLISTVLDFSPVLDKNQQLVGAIVHFSISAINNNSNDDEQSDANSVLSHFNMALRSPLTSLFSAVSTMSGRLDLEDYGSCRELLDHINQNCYSMLRSCTCITEYTRYSNALAYLKLKNINFTEFLKDILNTAHSLLRSAGIDLTFDIPATPMLLCCDPDKIVIVIMSVLANSAACIDEEKGDVGKQIHLSVTSTKSSVTINIIDHGIGISENILPHIFEPYFSHGDFSYSSIGLGLPLSKLIIAHHDGTIAVNSEEEKGTSVSFTISRNLADKNNDDTPFADDSSVYIKNRFSPVYIFLSKICECPEP